MQTLMVKWVSIVLVLVASLGAAFVAGRKTAPSRVVETTRVEYRDRTLVRRDTVRYRVAVPSVEVRYKPLTVTEVREVCQPVPLMFEPYAVTEANPIRVKGRSLIFTYFQPDSLRWMQEEYRVPRPKWGYKVSSTFGADAVRVYPHADEWARGAFVGLRGELRYRRVTGFVEPRASVVSPRVDFGLAFRLIGED